MEAPVHTQGRWTVSPLRAGTSRVRPQACAQAGEQVATRARAPRPARPGALRRGPLRPRARSPRPLRARSRRRPAPRSRRPRPRRLRPRPRLGLGLLALGGLGDGLRLLLGEQGLELLGALDLALLGLGLGALLGLPRGDLVLGRQLAALRDHDRADLGGDVLEDPDRNRVDADALDRLVQVDLAAVDADLLRRPDLVGDVGRRDRAEQAPARSGAALEAQLDAAELGRDLLGLLERAGLVPGAVRLALLVLGERARAWPSPRACAARGSCACSRARRSRRRRAGRPSRRPSGG